MNLIESIHEIVNKILEQNDNHIQRICKKIRKNISKYDDATLDLIDEYIKSNILEMNEVIAGSGLISTNGGVRPSNNELTENSDDILSFYNIDASKKERRYRIPYMLITMVLFSIVTSYVMLVFLKMAVSDTIGEENVEPILKKMLRLDGTAIVDIITSATKRRLTDVRDEVGWYKFLISTGSMKNVVTGLYGMFQTSDLNQHAIIISLNVQKITHAIYWLNWSGSATITLVGTLMVGQGREVLKYIKERNKNGKENNAIMAYEAAVKDFILDESVRSSKKRSKSSKQLMIEQDGGNKHKKNKTKKNKTKKN